MKTIGFLGLIIAALVAQQARSFPSVYVENSELRNISEPRLSGTLVGDLGDPKQVWVLPPHNGVASLTDVFISANGGLCPITKNLLNMAQLQEDRRIRYLSDLGRASREARRLKFAVDDSKVALDKLLANPDLRKIFDLMARVDSINSDIEQLYEDLEDAETSEERKAIRAKLKAKRDELKVAKKDLRKSKRDHRKVFREYEKAQRNYDSAKESYDEKVEQVKEAEKNLEETKVAIRSLFDRRAKIEVAMASINFDRRWVREVERLNNKHSRLSFNAMPTYNTRLSLSLVPTNSKGKLYTDLPALIAYGTFGTDLYFGERLKIGDPRRSNTDVPDEVPMSLRVNLLGGCPFVDKDFFADHDFDIKRDSEGKPSYTLTTTYEYDVAAPFNVEVSYNLWGIYKLIASQSPLYGSIEPSVIHELVKQPWPVELVSIKGAEAYSAAKSTQLQEEIKAELVNRVLTTVATPSSGSLAPMSELGLPPVEGAFALGYGQNTSCGTNILCQSGRWIVRIGDAIFGEIVGGEQLLSKRFKEDWDRVVTEAWNAENPVPRQGISRMPLKAKPTLDPALVDRAYNSYQQIAAEQFPGDLNVEGRSILYGFHVASKFDKDVFGETGVKPLINAIFEGNNTAVKLKTITSKEQFRQLVFPGDEDSLAISQRSSQEELGIDAFRVSTEDAAYAGDLTSLHQLDSFIDDEAFVERLNARSLSSAEVNEFAQLLEYRDSLMLAEIDRQLDEIADLLQVP